MIISDLLQIFDGMSLLLFFSSATFIASFLSLVALQRFVKSMLSAATFNVQWKNNSCPNSSQPPSSPTHPYAPSSSSSLPPPSLPPPWL